MLARHTSPVTAQRQGKHRRQEEMLHCSPGTPRPTDSSVSGLLMNADDHHGPLAGCDFSFSHPTRTHRFLKKKKNCGSLVARQQGGDAFNAKVAPRRLSTCVLGKIVFTRPLGAQTSPSHQP